MACNAYLESLKNALKPEPARVDVFHGGTTDVETGEAVKDASHIAAQRRMSATDWIRE